ncbi:MAG: serine/threonine protein kinase [Planctomycetes bacterium]|nr:serine/threonine protein kinase [Planctomycetota bacterium]
MAHDSPSSSSSGSKRRIGDFELLTKLGQGAMGAVYLARQIQLDRNVALKLLPPDLAQDQEFLERFRREARAAAKLNNPHIVMAYDVGVAGGYHYIAMEYVDGKDLEQGMQALAKGRFPEFEVLIIAKQMALALEAASAAGITHRDIKPANILKHSDGTYKLTDLGLAARKVDDNKVTQTGSAVGTPFYISPEQARGEQDVDVRSDIYSLGSTLYHLVTGKLPFPGDNSVVVMTRHLTEQVVPPDEIEPSVSKGLSRLIVKMMAKNPKDRHQDAHELLEDIEMVERGEVPLLKRARAKPKAPAAAPAATPPLKPKDRKDESRDMPQRSQGLKPRVSLPGSLHPRMSRMPAGRRPLQKTGPLASVRKLPKPVQLAIFLSLLFILAVVIGVVISRVVMPLLHSQAPPVQPAQTSTAQAPVKTAVPEKPPEPPKEEIKSSVPGPSPEHPAPPEPAPAQPEPPVLLTGTSLYKADFAHGNLDNWLVDEKPPPKPFGDETTCAAPRLFPGSKWWGVLAVNPKLNLQINAPDRSCLHIAYFLEKKEYEIWITLSFGGDMSKTTYKWRNPTVGQWSEKVINLNEFPITT